MGVLTGRKVSLLALAALLTGRKVPLLALAALLSVILVGVFGDKEDIVPVGALVVACVALVVTVYNINLSARPWLSVAGIAGDLLVAEELKTRDAVFKMPIRNTGNIPATDIRIESRFEGVEPKLSEAPALAPNTTCTVTHIVSLKGNLQGRTTMGKVQVLIRYSSLNRRHQTLQTFSVERAVQPGVRPEEGSFTFQPIKPTYFT